MNDTLPRCARCEENQARYIDEIGLLVCGTCPIAGGFDSIRLADVPQLLQWARDVLAGGSMDGYSFGKLREIVGKHPNETGGEHSVMNLKNTWPCPGKPEARAGMPIGMYHCEFCGEMQIAGSTHLAPQFPSQWEPPFPIVVGPDPRRTLLRVTMKDGRVFEGALFDRSYDHKKREGWLDLAVDHTARPEVPEVFLFEECANVVDVESPDVNLLPVWISEKV